MFEPGESTSKLVVRSYNYIYVYNICAWLRCDGRCVHEFNAYRPISWIQNESM